MGYTDDYGFDYDPESDDAEYNTDHVIVQGDEVMAMTEKAILVRQGTKERWVPRSQISADGDVVRSKRVRFYAPRWLVKAKKLEFEEL